MHIYINAHIYKCTQKIVKNVIYLVNLVNLLNKIATVYRSKRKKKGKIVCKSVQTKKYTQ